MLPTELTRLAAGAHDNLELISMRCYAINKEKGNLGDCACKACELYHNDCGIKTQSVNGSAII